MDQQEQNEALQADHLVPASSPMHDSPANH